MREDREKVSIRATHCDVGSLANLSTKSDAEPTRGPELSTDSPDRHTLRNRIIQSLRQLEPVLIIGATGRLGLAFHELANPLQVVGVSKRELDVSDGAAVIRLVESIRPSLIINCSAYNDVDSAELHPLDAIKTNADGAWNVAIASKAVGATLVHYSTDFVFDGCSSLPYAETDPTGPISVYGQSKLIGERYVRCVWHRSYILRLSSLYGGPSSRAFVDTVVNRALRGERVYAFTDRTVSPSFAPDVVLATSILVAKGAPHDVYHCVSSDGSTWYELAAHILGKLSRPDLLTAALSSEIPMKAKRPRNCVLSACKIATIAGVSRSWRETLDQHLDSLMGV